MAKPARGLPEGFSLSLPAEMPSQIGDFFEEEDLRSVELLKRLRKEEQKPGVGQEERSAAAPVSAVPLPPTPAVEPRGQPERKGEGYFVERTTIAPPAPAPPQVLQARKPLRKQLNLSPLGEQMLDEIVEHVRTFSGQSDARVSEVFQAIVALLFSAKDELDLSALPKRGAWGSVTAKNFPSALAEAFERAIVRRAEKSREG